MREFLWQRLPAVRRAERSRFVFFFLLSGGLSFSGTLGLVGSEALFLTHVGPSQLPLTIVLASMTTVLACLAYAWVVGRSRNDRLFTVMLLGAALFLWLILNWTKTGTAWAWIALFCCFYIFQAVFVQLHFWTFVTDFFDTLASKRIFPLFAVGASLGGVLGGGGALVLNHWLPAQSLIAGWALSLLVCGAILIASRTRLMSWRVLGTAEADESSAEGMLGALRYMARSSLARWLGVSVAGMMVTLTVMQYLYLDIFSKAFDDTQSLARFFAIYAATANAIELGVELRLTPWLIQRLGVARANLAHPVLTLVSVVALAVDPRLWAAMLARADYELFQHSMAQVVRALFYNALPHRFRGRMRALLDGVFYYAAISLAGALLLLLSGQLGPLGLAILAGLGAAVYGVANWLVRREYLKSLVSELRRGRIDLDDVTQSLDSQLLATLAEPWEEALSDPSARYGTALLDLAVPLASGGHAERVRRQFGHPRTAVRVVCLEALLKAEVPDSDELLIQRLADPDPSMRRRATELARQLSSPRSPELTSALHSRLDDSDAAVRADAAATLGPEGWATLESMLWDPARGVRHLALERAPAALLPSIREQFSDADPALRASVIQAMVRLGATDLLPLGELIEDMRSPHSPLRQAAASGLASHSEDAAVDALARALDDDVRSVRQGARNALVGLGAKGLQAALPLCHHYSLTTAEAALEIVHRTGGKAAQSLLSEQYRARVEEAWISRLALERCAPSTSLDLRFLRAALHNAESRGRILALAALERSERRDVVQSIVRTLDRPSGRARGDALEVLCNLGERTVSAQLALLLEDGPLQEAINELGDFITIPRDLTDVIQMALESSDPWLRMAASRYVAGQRETGPTQETSALSQDELRNHEAQIMERLLALQHVPLFARLSLEQLQRIDELMQEEQFLEGEIVIREGDAGDNLYVLMEGSLAFYRNWQNSEQRILGHLEPVGYMGEIALLDDEPRTVTAVATQDCRFLTLAGARFKELLLQSPEMGFELFRALTARIRAAENRAEQIGSGNSG